MSDTLLSSHLAQARELYERFRSDIETPQNVGKLVSIDITTGNYAVGDDNSFAALRSLRARNPQADIVTLRIGYNAVYALGGVLERTTL
jgi:hypothetical protein